MKKTLIAALVLSALSLTAAPAMAKSDKPEPAKILICHATSSATNPYTLNEVSVNSIKHMGHKAHEGDIIPATPECMGTLTPIPEVDEPTVEATIPVPDHAEPGVEEKAEEVTYPAPVVTPNTVNGVPPVGSQPTPGPTTSAEAIPVAKVPTELAYTGANDWLWLWAGAGLIALLAGVASVIHVRRNA